MARNRIYVAGERGLVGVNLTRYLRQLHLDFVSTGSDMLDLRNREATDRFFAKTRPDLVVLVAARHGGIGVYQAQPVETLEDNVLISGNVIRCCFEYGVKRLIYIGASCVYPGLYGTSLHEEDYDKQMVQKPTEPYGLAKLYGMKLCEYYNREKGTEFISVLPVNLYGDGMGYRMDETSVLPSLLRRFHTAKEEQRDSVEIWGSGEVHREFLHARDFSKAVTALLLADRLDHTMFNVGSGEELTINELAALIAKIVGFHGKIVRNFGKPGGSDRGILDCGRIRQLGWAPEISLERGLTELYRNLLRRHLL